MCSSDLFLYEEQTRRGISVKHFDEFSDVADHCTVCHKCATPCPVDIDFGDVSINMRNLLRKLGQKKFNPGLSVTMAYLNATNPTTIKLIKAGLIDFGFKLQRFAFGLARGTRLARIQTRRGISVQHWEDFEDVADHCTVCHKCLSPCPVDIDLDRKSVV